MELIEFLRQISGPKFLAIFLASSVLCIALAKIFIDADGSSSFPSVESGLDPISIAVLQGGVNSVIRSRVFGLMNQGLIAIEGEKKNMLIRATGATSTEKLTELDREVLAFVVNARTPEELFRDKDFLARVESRLVDIKADLESRHLIRGRAQQVRAVRIALFFGAVIAVFGGIKLYLGLTHDKPVAFLVILLLLSEVVLILIFRSGMGLTRLGRETLKNLRERFQWTLKKKTLPQGVDLSFLVALYGAGHLSVSSLYPQYSEAFRRYATSGCSGGCGGSGCSGSSGGCSGGGCGGCGGD